MTNKLNDALPIVKSSIFIKVTKISQKTVGIKFLTIFA